MRGSRICTARAPARRARRVARPAWRPQPIASAGGRAKAPRKPLPNARSAPGNIRGASCRHGARACRLHSSACSFIASASARAWRRFPALPSVRIQVSGWGVRCSMDVVNPLQARRVLRATSDSTLAGDRRDSSRPDGGPMAQHPHEALDPHALDRLFREARPHDGVGGEVSDGTVRALYELLKWGPTSANRSPARCVFVKSPEAKALLEPALGEGNRAKTMAAPVTVI